MSTEHKPAKPLLGKVTLVTGGSRGIGAAIANRLAGDGATVAITYKSSPGRAEEVVRAIESTGVRGLAIEADAADAKAVRASVERVVRELGGIDILVNNAGVAAMASIESFSMEDFERLIAVNITGLFVATQEAVRHMRAGGRIIHIGSCNSERVPFSGGSVYALTKGAVAAFTKALARDLGPRAITVNNVQPGPVDTEMNPAAGPFAEMAKQHIALQRYGKSDEVASLVSYLAGPEATFVTGASLLVDGGYSA
ncbi:MAG: 3-oxoacyl-ACP reductase FabG [Acidobacteria bacterium]|nr:3-oxoacyl-ACP reductase FabG [Acidobacteriota bacterium]